MSPWPEQTPAGFWEIALVWSILFFLVLGLMALGAWAFRRPDDGHGHGHGGRWDDPPDPPPKLPPGPKGGIDVDREFWEMAEVYRYRVLESDERARRHAGVPG